MPKIFYTALASSLVFSISSYASDNNMIQLDTSKTVESTRLKPRASLAPKIDFNNVLSTPSDKTTDIYFSADEINSDSNSEIVKASGKVEIIREDLTLYSDNVTYNQKDEHIMASGNVVLVEKSGNVIFADKVDLTDKLQNADIENIKITMLDKTRLAARSFHKKADNTKVMRQAVYTPCDNCYGSDPLWQIKAHKVIHNPESQDVEYQHAFMEIKGIPVLYAPYFSHPDPSVKHRSGFLFPRILSTGYLGASIQPQYFWDISPQENITFNPIFSSEKDPIYSAIYSKYLPRGEINATGSVMQDEEDGRNTKKTRGNLFLYSRYELNNIWVADTDINYSSDINYLKDISLPKKDDSWLTSRLRFQAFDNRNYAEIETYYYDMLSYNLQDYNTPYVLPLMSYENISSPDKYGAYVRTVLSTSSIYHEKDNSSHRLSMINSWNLPYTSPYGEKYKLTASLKTDGYYVDKYNTPYGEEFTGTTARVFPQLGMEWRLPFIKSSQSSSQILEPIIVGAFAPNDNNKTEKIPNEDSQDVEVTDVNIFDLDRYPGYDRNDTGSRISYGINWSSYGKSWGRTALLLGQTYEFSKKNNLSDRTKDDNFSDFVGHLQATPNQYLDLNYRFKLDKDDYSVTYSELSASIGSQVLKLNTSYIFFPETDENYLYNGARRKELYSSVSSYITRNWSIDIYTRQDLINKHSISNGGGIAYEDECSRFAFNMEKEFSTNPDDEDENNFYFSFYLKTLGNIGNK